MFYYPDGSVQLRLIEFRDANEITHPAAALQVMTDEQRADLGIYRYQEDVIPQGHRVISSTLELNGIVMTRKFVTMYDLANLEAEKADKKAMAQAIKKSVVDGGVMVNGVLFDTDERAVLAYLSLAVEFMLDPTTVISNWKASLGVWVTMDLPLFIQVKAAYREQQTAAFNWQQAIEIEINRARDDIELAMVRMSYD